MVRSTLLRCLALILLVACTVVAHDHGHHGHAHDHGHGHAHDDKPANKYSREANQDGPSVDEMAAQKLDEVAEVQARMQKENEERLQSQQAQQQAKNTVNNAQLIADKKRALEEAKARAVANQKMRTEALEKKKLQEQEAQRLQAVKEQAEAEERRLEQERQDKEKREEEERLAINQRLREEKEAEERLKQEAERLEREQREERERKQAEERERLEREQRERHEAEERERAEREERERKEAEERHAAEVQAQAEEENRRKVQELLEQEQAKAREEQEEQERVRREQDKQERVKKEHEEQERIKKEHEEQERVAQAQKDAEAQADSTKTADQEASQDDGSTDTFAADSAATTPIEFGKLPITTTQKALVATGLVSVLPVFILPFVPIDNTKESQRLLNVLLAFASGGLMGDVFLHLLPHALFPHSHGSTAEDAHAHSHGEVHEDAHAHAHNDDGAHNHDHTTYVGLWVLAGFMSFFLIEKIMRNGSSGGHGHSHATPAAIFQEKPALDTVVEEDESEREVSVEPPVRASVDRRSRERRSMSRSVSVAPVEVVEAVVVEEVLPQQPIAVAAYLNLVADFSHNFTDGLAIAAAYLASDALGFSTMLAILFHEIPHEVGDYAILIRSGFSRPKAMVAQLSTAIGAMLGAVVGLMAQEFMQTTAWILPLTAGGFIYIATTTVIPDLLTDCSYGQTFLEILAMCTGVGMMVVIAQFEE